MPSEPTSGTPSEDPEVVRALERLDLRDAMIAGLAAGANDLAEAAQNLVSAARLSRWEKIIAIFLLALSTISTVAVGVMAVLLLNIAQDNRANGNLIRDCVVVGGECYREQNARSKAVVQRIIESNQVFVRCSLVTPRLDDDGYDACVQDGLAALD